MQKKYEALRASYVDMLTDQQVAERYGFTYYSFKSLKRDLKGSSPADFFKPASKGPKNASNKSTEAKDIIVNLRKRNYSVPEIKDKLMVDHQISLSAGTINSILHNEGFTRLFRRTFRERMETLQEKNDYPEKSNVKLFGQYDNVNTGFGGVFLFMPIIMELGLDRLWPLDFYGSKVIPPMNYLLSYLCVKLLGSERLSHCGDYSFDYGLGVFAGLNTLPKSATLSSYSYNHGTSSIETMLSGFAKLLHKHGYIKGNNINLDFHSIPYFGDTEEIERNWVATRGKRMQSVLSFFAQDLDTTFLCYSNADIKVGEQNDEILKFVNFYKGSTGILPERLIFDSKLTTYKNLDQLDKKGILFITLGRRGSNFEKEIAAVTQWETVRLDNVKRKYRKLLFHVQEVKIKDYENHVLQIYVKGNGRELPMRLLTNDFESSIKSIITYYSHRWRIETNIGENVDFFNLNGLQSNVVVQVNFDVAMTLIANTLYKILAKNIRWFENQQPKTISRKFLNIDTSIHVGQDNITVKYKKKSYVPVIKDWVNMLGEIKIPWCGNKKLNFSFG